MASNLLRPHAMYSSDVILLLLLGLNIVGQSKPIEVECDPGLYLDEDLKVCRDCEPETYSSTRNRAAYCAECSKHCFDRRHGFKLHECSPTHDLICQCRSGYFALSDRFQCRKHTSCPENCFKHRGNASMDAICHEPCPTTSPAKELLVESSNGSTAVVMTYESTTSSLLDMTTSSSNQTAPNNFQHIGLQVLVAVVSLSAVISLIALIIYCRKKSCQCLALKRAYHIYQTVSMNENPPVNHSPVNYPPEPPPHRNGSLAAGNDHDTMHQQFDGLDQRSASILFENEVPSHGAMEEPLQEPEPLYDVTILLDAQQNEALAEGPNSQILPIVPGATGEAASSEDVEGVHLPEAAYTQVHLLFDSSDVQDSPTGHDSEDLDTSNTSNSHGLRIPPTRPCSGDLQDSHRTSERPCVRVQPWVMPRPQLNPQGNHPQLPEVNHPQHNQPNNQPGVPSPVVVVESIYSLDAPNEVD